eukprot:UN14994
MIVFKSGCDFGHRAILNENFVGDGKYLSCIVSYLKNHFEKSVGTKNFNLFRDVLCQVTENFYFT